MSEEKTGISEVSAADGGRSRGEAPKLRLMLDIETLGTAPRSVITEVAVVDIDDGHRVCFQEYLDIDAQVEMGRTIDGATVRWWMGQEAVGPRPRERLSLPGDFFASFFEWCRGLGGGAENASVEWWCNGASFDFPILKDLWGQLGGKESQLWHFWRLMCFRTVARLEDPDRQLEPEFVGRRHSALDDARHQAAWLRKIEWKREVTRE